MKFILLNADSQRYESANNDWQWAIAFGKAEKFSRRPSSIQNQFFFRYWDLGHVVPQQWILGPIDSRTKHGFLEFVLNRTAEPLKWWFWSGSGQDQLSILIAGGLMMVLLNWVMSTWLLIIHKILWILILVVAPIQLKECGAGQKLKLKPRLAWKERWSMTICRIHVVSAFQSLFTLWVLVSNYQPTLCCWLIDSFQQYSLKGPFQALIFEK